MPIVCIDRPNRTKKRVYTERDVGRIIRYARQDGADDALILAYVAQAFELRELPCLMFRILDTLNQVFFLEAILGALTGMLTMLKALKILRTGRRSTIPGFLELILPKKWLGSLGKFLLAIGAAQVIVGVALGFVSSIANNVSLLVLMGRICGAETFTQGPSVEKLEIGGLQEQLAVMDFKLRRGADELEEL